MYLRAITSAVFAAFLCIVLGSPVMAQTPDGDPLIVSAGAIILAASGFGASSELVSRFIPEVTGIPYYGAPYSTGDAIEWGRSMGAAADHMNSYQSHSSIAREQH